MTTSYPLLIDGALVPGDQTLEVVNPATGAVFTTVARASARQADAAVEAAAAAAPAWAETPIARRAEMVVGLADAITANAEELATALTMEQGKPLAQAQMEIALAEAFLRHHATIPLPDRVIQDDADGYIAVMHRPLGVVVGIVPWNFPLALACGKLGPALLAGNTIVLKPAPTTPVTALILGRLCQQIFPAGTVNIVVDNNDLGPHLVAHPKVAKISFTGSTGTGKAIFAASAPDLKRLTLELGGNDPAIVLPDVDVAQAAEAIYGNAFLNAGQVCVAVKRVYVHADIHDRFCEELARLANAAELGDGLSDTTQIGPVQNAAQFEKLQDLMKDAASDGQIIAGGSVVDGPGYFMRPTIVRDITDGARLVDEEQFGPILPVIRFTSVEEVIGRINAGKTGLGASVWSADADRAATIAARVESGQVWVNQHLAIGPHIPMAGFKHSGIGVEQSSEGLAAYTQIQVINIRR